MQLSANAVGRWPGWVGINKGLKPFVLKGLKHQNGSTAEDSNWIKTRGNQQAKRVGFQFTASSQMEESAEPKKGKADKVG